MFKTSKSIFNSAANIFGLAGLLLLITALIFELKSKYPNYSPICLESKPDDSESFGTALAANDNYLVVGDPKANRVAVYQRQQESNWLRQEDILPPQEFSQKNGCDFGSNLALNNKILVIRAKNRKKLGVPYSDELYVKAINDGYSQIASLHKIQYRDRKLRNNTKSDYQSML